MYKIMIKNISILLFLVLAINACKKPDEEPEFKYVKNVQVKKIAGTEVLLTADAVFFNPNDMKMKLRGVDVDLYVKEKKVGKINQEVKTRIPANDEFEIPFSATFDIKEVGVLNTLMSLMGGNKLPVRYKGHIKATVHGFPFRVPIDYEEEVRIR